MSDDEDFDELPEISVQSANRDSSRFSMPDAGELAAERAREASCERELRELRHLARSDSESSEGDTALAAAAGALRVRPVAREPPPSLDVLLAAAAPLLPAAAPFLRAAAARPASTLGRLQRALQRPAPAVALAAAAWLCLALVAAEGARLGPAVARAAHAALEAAGPACEELAPALLAAVHAPRARLQLADALRGGGARSGALAARIESAALDALQAAGWRRLQAADRYAALQLAARARARADPQAEELLAALGSAPAVRDHSPEALKVLVAAAKLQLLFRVKK